MKVEELSVDSKIRLVYPAQRELSHAAREFLQLVQGGWSGWRVPGGSSATREPAHGGLSAGGAVDGVEGAGRWVELRTGGFKHHGRVPINIPADDIAVSFYTPQVNIIAFAELKGPYIPKSSGL